MVATPLRFSRAGHSKTLKKDLGHIGNLFYIICGRFDEKEMGVPPYPGVAKSKGEGVDATFFSKAPF